MSGNNRVLNRVLKNFEYLFLAFMLFVFTIVCVWHTFSVEAHVNGLATKIEDNITQYTKQKARKAVRRKSAQTVAVAETTDPNLEFLKEQIESHQDFIERERETLIWMMGVLVSVAGIIVAFLGIKSKKDVKELVDKHYKDEIQNQFTELLGGDKKNVDYLVKRVKEDIEARKKKVLFILQKKKDSKEDALKSVRLVYDEFLDDGNVKAMFAHDFQQNKDHVMVEERMDEKLKKYDVVVYEAEWEMDENEKKYNVTAASVQHIKSINDYCVHNGKRAIFLTLKGLLAQDTRDELDGRLCETVNGTNKLCQSLDTLLYRSPGARG